MKAFILAAGFGTRLLPYTKKIPKPLFTILSRPVLEHVILQLVDAGCEQIFINTHHLHEQVNAYVAQSRFNLQTLYEPELLDTGGAIANAKPYLKEGPFFVINADILSNIDLKAAYDYHLKSNCPATLILHDFQKFNKITLNDQGYVENFEAEDGGLAFTGIQVLSPEIFNYYPDEKIFSSIAVYQQMATKKLVNAWVVRDIFWSDIGTKEAYAMTSLLMLAASQFGLRQNRMEEIHLETLAGDGSDRLWVRATHGQASYVICNHGICMPGTDALGQLNAFICIGHHLLEKRIPVPRILNHDTLSGMVLLEDLGDTHLQTQAQLEKSQNRLFCLYQQVIDHLVLFSTRGAEGFDTQWTCQTATYSKELILEKECRYFVEAFLQDHRKLNVSFEDFSDEFTHIADHALKHGVMGLMHRDMQSRNIMLKNGAVFFIDFQSARIGPLQYDLASLLIDPYISLNATLQKDLLCYTMDLLDLSPNERAAFSESYHYCCLTRNLQFLGAFSFLSGVKKKKIFEQYIPVAVNSLKVIMQAVDTVKLAKLFKLIQTL